MRTEFPDGIKNSVLSIPKSKTKEENKITEQSYEQIARDSNVGTATGDEESLGEERKIGELHTERGTDLRYNIDAIIENSI